MLTLKKELEHDLFNLKNSKIFFNKFLYMYLGHIPSKEIFEKKVSIYIPDIFCIRNHNFFFNNNFNIF